MGSGGFASCLLSGQGMWSFRKSPSPGLRCLIREQAAPFLAGLPSHCFPALHLSFSFPSFYFF